MLHKIAFILLVVGGLNWLLVGIGGFMGSDWNIVSMVLGSWMWLEYLVYVLVGLSAVYELFGHKKSCKMCGGGASAPMGGM